MILVKVVFALVLSAAERLERFGDRAWPHVAEAFDRAACTINAARAEVSGIDR